MPDPRSTTTTPIPVGEPFDPATQVVGLTTSTGAASFIVATGGPPRRIDGYTIGAPIVTQNPPHGGEMHPDGDEMLFVVSGRFHVSLELGAGARVVDLQPGDALIVPRGIWHLVTMQEPGQLVHITPGPGGEHRPVSSKQR